MALLAPSDATEAPRSPELRIADVTVSDDGVLTATVMPPQQATDGSEYDLQIEADGAQRDVQTASVRPEDVAIAVVADTSAGQPIEQFHQVRNLVTDLALRVSTESPMALVGTTAPPVVTQRPTTDVIERIGAVDRLEMSGQRALRDAVAQAAQQLSSLPHEHRRIIAVASGPDEASRMTNAQMAEQLAAAAATLYVAIPGGGSAPSELAESASQTGGLVLTGATAGDPFAAASAVIDDLSGQLRFTSPLDANADQTITLRLSTVDGAVAEATIDVPAAGGPSSQADRTLERPATTNEVAADAVPQSEAPFGWLPAILAVVAVGGVTLFLLILRRTRAVPAARVLISTGRARMAAGAGDVRGSIRDAAAARRAAVDRRPSRVRAAGSVFVNAVERRLTGVRHGVREWLSDTRIHRTAVAGTGHSLVTTGQAGTALRRTRIPGRSSSWQEVAADVHEWMGGEPLYLHRAAANIEADRRMISIAARGAARRWRIFAACATALPVAAGVIRQIVDPAFVGRIAMRPPASVLLIVALALTVTGGIWLRVVTEPGVVGVPSARGRRHRDHLRRCEVVADTADTVLLSIVARNDFESTTADVAGKPQEPVDLGAALRLLAASGTTREEVVQIRTTIYSEWKRALDDNAREMPRSITVVLALTILPAVTLIALAGS